MVIYTCPNCSKVFNRKSSFINHTENKKYPCNKNIYKSPIFTDFTETSPEVKINDEEFKVNSIQNDSEKAKFNCEHCEKYFKNKFTLERHQNGRCKVIKQNENKKKNQNNNQVNVDELDIDIKTKMILSILMNQNKKLIEEMNQIKDKHEKLEEENKEIKEENKEMKEKIKKVSNRVSNKIINSNNVTNQNTQNNTINNTNIILAHGKEDLSKIELDAIMSYMSTIKHKEIIPNITKHIYLNNKKPENKNFCVVDMARNKCKYYNGEKWLVGKTNEKIEKIFDNLHNMLTDPFEKENINKTIEFIKTNPKKFNEKWIRISNTYLKSLYDEDDKENVENKIKVLNELKLIFFNNKDEILQIQLEKIS